MPAMLADPEALRASAVAYRQHAQQSNELSDAIRGIPTPPMPYWVELESRWRLGRSAAALAGLRSELIAYAGELERTATLFEESQRSSPTSELGSFVGVLFEFSLYGVPFGAGMIRAMERLRIGRAPTTATKRLPWLTAALDVAHGMNEQAIRDQNLKLSPGEQALRLVIGGIVRAAPAIAGARAGEAIGFAAGGALLAPIGLAPLGVVIGAGIGAAAGSYLAQELGGKPAADAADALLRSPADSRSGVMVPKPVTSEDARELAQSNSEGKPQPTGGLQCLEYAQKRWATLYPNEDLHARGNTGNPGAYNLLFEGNDAAIGKRKMSVRLRSLAGVTQLSQVHPDDLIVWDLDGGLDPTYGHVAVVEVVGPDWLVISENNYNRDLMPGWRVLGTAEFRQGVFLYSHP